MSLRVSVGQRVPYIDTAFHTLTFYRPPTMSGYFPLILATLVGFALLAYLLLAPVYKFLEREQEASQEWTPDRVAERIREREASTNGTESTGSSETPADET